MEFSQGSYGHGKSWNLKIHFPGLEKSWILGKMAEVMEKLRNFVFLVHDFVLFENWKTSPSHRAKMYPKRLDFLHF